MLGRVTRFPYPGFRYIYGQSNVLWGLSGFSTLSFFESRMVKSDNLITTSYLLKIPLQHEALSVSLLCGVGTSHTGR
jgi:hypothetical protein